jgi:hypothetical protein
MRTCFWTVGEVVPWGVNAPPNFNISIFQNICKNLQNNMFEGQKLCLDHCLHNGHLMHICGHPCTNWSSSHVLVKVCWIFICGNLKFYKRLWNWMKFVNWSSWRAFNICLVILNMKIYHFFSFVSIILDSQHVNIKK